MNLFFIKLKVPSHDSEYEYLILADTFEKVIETIYAKGLELNEDDEARFSPFEISQYIDLWFMIEDVRLQRNEYIIGYEYYEDDHKKNILSQIELSDETIIQAFREEIFPFINNEETCGKDEILDFYSNNFKEIDFNNILDDTIIEKEKQHDNPTSIGVMKLENIQSWVGKKYSLDNIVGVLGCMAALDIKEEELDIGPSDTPGQHHNKVNNLTASLFDAYYPVWNKMLDLKATDIREILWGIIMNYNS